MTKSIHILFIILFLLNVFNTSFSQTISFENPIARQRADPWVYKTEGGIYYLIATVPQYDRLTIRKANSINGLKSAVEKTVWTKHATGEMGAHIWAPELHKINGKWYIYFAAGSSDDIWKIRMYALSNTSEDPMEGKWMEEGRIVTQENSFSLDATTFEYKGKRFLLWAQTRGDGTGIILSEMSSPTKLTGPEIVLSKPELAWERIGHNVNEGPAVIIRNGKIFVTYSASATDHNYCIGLLWLEEGADLLKAANWRKSQSPVFYTNEALKRFGPGHNSFTTTEDGKTDVLIYHARDFKEIQGDPLNDPNRHTRARFIQWSANGFPDFMQDKEDNFKGVSVTGIQSHDQNKLELFPNPFSGKGLQITYPGFYNYWITDLTGRLQEQGNSVDKQFVGEKLTPGIYLIYISNSEGTQIEKVEKL